jgi:hypothetical protein
MTQSRGNGTRGVSTRRGHLGEAFSQKTRLVAARLMDNSVIVNVPKDDETDMPVVLLQFVKNNASNRNFIISLSRMTVEELDLFEEIVNIAINLARPLSHHLDQWVEENKEELSADFESRLYRPLPTVVYGKGALAAYDQELFDGYQDVLRGLGFALR